MLYNRQKFFAGVRSAFGPLKQSQVTGFNLLLAEGEKRGISSEWIAYILATAWHETAFTMQPVKEYGSQAYLRSKKYWPYVGRGYVQLTWDYNYKKMGDWLGIDLFNNPDKAMDPAIAVQVTYEGMIRGMFTAKSLSTYLDSVNESDEEDFREFTNARRIINGTDRARDIANYAVKFERVLYDAEEINSVRAGFANVSVPPPPNKEEVPAQMDGTILGTIGSFLTALVGILANLDPIIQVLLILIVAGFAFWVIKNRFKFNAPDIKKIF